MSPDGIRSNGLDELVAGSRALLLLTSAEGLLVVGSVFWDPSMDRNAVILGYSLPRIAAGLGFLAFTCFCILLAIRAFRDPGWLSRIAISLDETFASNPRRLVASTFGLLLAFVSGSYILFLFRARYVPNPPIILQAAADRLFGGFLLIVIMPLQLLILLAVSHTGQLRKTLAEGGYGRTRLVLFAVVTVGLLQWTTLVLQADWLYQIPGWFWRYHPKRLELSAGYLLLTSVIVLVTARAVLHHPMRRARNVVLCVGLVVVAQVGFGFAEGEGFESLRQKYVNTPLSDVMRLACEYPGDAGQAIRSYEAVYADSFWLGTKPPGLFAFYVGIRDLAAMAAPEIAISSTQCVEIVSRLAAIVMPVLAALVVVFVYVMERTFSQDGGEYVSGLLYACTPSVLLMPLVPDQFLFPLLFMVSMTLVAKAIKGRSLVFGILAGAFLYVCVFVSFSLLPVLALGLLWFFFAGVREEKGQRLRLTVAAVGAFVGMLATWLAVGIATSYNPAVRVAAALDAHRLYKEIALTPQHVAWYASLNLTEFGLWSGIPLLVLAAIGLWRSAAAFKAGRGGGASSLALAFGASFLGLLVGGQTSGEVGRLWIFLVPLACVFAGPVASQALGDRSRSVMIMMTVQLITACLMFIYMDFR